jgi:hypothetical protein
VIRWTATDGITPASGDQVVTIGTGIQADDAFYLENGAALRDEGGNPISLLNSGTGQSAVGVESFTDSIIAGGNASVAPNGNVLGDITVGGTASVDPAANYSGLPNEGATIILPELPTLPAFDPPMGDDDWVGPGETLTLPVGSYPIIGINSNPSDPATLELLDGDYFFTELHINADAILRTSPGTRIFVSGYFGVHDRVTFEGGPLYIGLAGNQDSTIESSFTGTLIAPDRHIEFGVGSGVTFTGSFLARSIRVRPNSTLVCVATDAAVTPDPGCNDGDVNGDETDVDCGGPVCPGCSVGEACSEGVDCVEGVCSGNICAAPTCNDNVKNGGEEDTDCGGPCTTSCEPPATISAEVVSPSLHDWGWGYCVEIRITNEGSTPITGWSVTVNTISSTIYDDWNGVFSGNSGTVTATPEFEWNQTLDPGEVSTAIGFCANRWTPFSGVLPSIAGTSP